MSAQACACGTCANCTAAAGRTPDRAFTFRHSQVRGRMLRSIAGTEVAGLRPLAALGTRALDDPTIALIDAHAASLHLLAWNCERLGEDATITRSEDRDALVALSRLLGYEPRPALSATTTLAFTLDDFPGSPGTATIPAGTKVASMPAQDELPQTFETDVAIEARAEWNAILPLQQHATKADATSAWVKGVEVAVKPGDHLLSRSGQTCRLAMVTAIERVPETGKERTRIEFVGLRDIQTGTGVEPPAAGTVVILGQRAAPFGATAPDADLMPADSAATENTGDGREWKDFIVGAPTDPAHQVDLDAVYADALDGRWTVFVAQFLTGSGDKWRTKHTKREQKSLARLGSITASTELSRADFGMAAKITRMEVSGIPLDAPDTRTERERAERERELGPGFDEKSDDTFTGYVRETTIYIETGRAELFEFIIDRPLPADPSLLDVVGTVDLPAGRKVLLAGEAWAGAADVAGNPAAEIAEVARVEAIGGGTRLHFRRPVATRFRSATLVVNGNCAPASHGETLPGDPEILGSSSGNAAAPRFTLARGPLAYVPADNPRGYAPALEVRVNDRRYDEVPMLYGQPAAARTYTVRQVAGKSEVQFASRLPRGTYNVTARYRTGGGTAGLLGAGRLTSLVSPVLGVSAATNPLATEGGSDAVTIDQLREAAPRYVRTLVGVVSLADFEAFASDYRGVGKAMASELHDGMRALVVLTVADSAMAPPPAGSDILTDLADALAGSAVPGRKVIVQGYSDYLAVLEIKLASDSALQREKVEAAVRAALAARFGRAARPFARDLHTSELLAVIQEVPGVRAALVSQWQRALAEPFTPQTGAGEETRRLRCPGVALDSLAGLLSVDPDHVAFKELDA
jgi:hypothetical protein